ncbi:MAG: glycoside hydrolase family 88 protein [Deinococcales bacterium]
MTAVGTSTLFEEALGVALAQVRANLEPFSYIFPDNNTIGNLYPDREPRKDHVTGGNSGWTTSFWTGQLWLAYELTTDPDFKSVAETHLMSFKDRLDRRVDVAHHDIGFLYSLSAVAQYTVTKSPDARALALRAADVLLERWLPGYGVLQAWGELSDPAFRGRFIIDCMLNLPLLFWAHRQTERAKYLEVALEHARQSQRHLLREDGSSYHTVFVNPDGSFARTMTHQGASDSSRWARGQAWTILGFALVHKLGSQDFGFLETAKKAADFYLAHLPEDFICYWDLDLNNVPGEERDSSAAAIAACGLLELGAQTGEAKYREAAVLVLESLIKNYANTQVVPRRPLLLEGVYRKPHGIGINEGCIWGDYYYLEALMRVTNQNWKAYW